MSIARSNLLQIDKIRQELLNASHEHFFEIHHNEPTFWNGQLDIKMEAFLAQKNSCTYSTCPICGHKMKAPEFSADFHDPWWLYPQRAFAETETCPHFEALSFSILWTNSEPMSAPWIIPCGWGVPALSEQLLQNDNLTLSIKSSYTPNGAIIFWLGFYRQLATLPFQGDLWPIPILKSRTPIDPSPSTRGYWNNFTPIQVHSPLVWARLFIEQDDGTLLGYETKRDTSAWLNRIRTWSQLAYSQPLKMCGDRFIAESGFSSFAIAMKNARIKSDLFISHAPILANNPITAQSNTGPDPKLKAFNHILSIEQLDGLAQTESLWAIIDPFQNEATQDWLRLIRHNGQPQMLPIWTDSDLADNWILSADASHLQSIVQPNLVEFYRDLSPILVKITPEILELSYRYTLGNQAWGCFFISQESEATIHHFLRNRLIANVQSHWVYFRFYDSAFLATALSKLDNSDLAYFFGPIMGWILRNSGDDGYRVLTNTQRPKDQLDPSLTNTNIISSRIESLAESIGYLEIPKRIKTFLEERTPEFAQLIPPKVLDRWVRVSVKDANSWGIKNELNIIKYFLWKVLITPTWCHLPPFIKILQQTVPEEVKVQQIENLFPQIKLAEIPKTLSIQSWDSDLWIKLRGAASPFIDRDPSIVDSILGETPPLMPLKNPDWLKALGVLYETGYAELAKNSGIQLLSVRIRADLDRPHHPPPRLVSITANEVLVKDDGQRSLPWLKERGFRSLAAKPNCWILGSINTKKALQLAREFLQEFPYIESKYLFDGLAQEDRYALIRDLELFTIYWDAHRFWMLNRF